jgi:Rrf2 family protein
LARNHLLTSEQGTKGGYRLARDPRTISALEVIRAIDGPVVLTSCSHETGGCDQLQTCTVKAPLQKVHEGILRLLDSITISEMTTNDIVWPIQSAGYIPAAMSAGTRPAAPAIQENS